MHKYKVATCKYVYGQNEVDNLEYFERGGLEKHVAHLIRHVAIGC